MKNFDDLIQVSTSDFYEEKGQGHPKLWWKIAAWRL